MMAKKIIVAVKCTNYDKHIAEIENHPDRHHSSLFIREDVARGRGWQKKGKGWLCPDCIRRSGDWGLEGDMI
jgi:hypothetical protein